MLLKTYGKSGGIGQTAHSACLFFFAFSDGQFYLLFVGAGVGLPEEPP
jgi:hypothetical protein